MTIPDYLKEKINFVIAYVDNTTDDWFRIKIELINSFPIEDRSRFSRRHNSTKKQMINSFDKEVITYWEEQTGVKLWINPDKLHPTDWVPNPRGWKLKEINEERRKRKIKKTD